MTHLIKLELKKFGIAQNIIFMFAAILFSILFITISLWDSMTDPKQVKDTFESTYLVIGLLMSFIFLVYSSVLTAKLVIGEYNHRTITIMFSYPLNRIKLIASKLTIIMVYTAISMTIIRCAGPSWSSHRRYRAPSRSGPVRGPRNCSCASARRAIT